jgi:hypothetical protein
MGADTANLITMRGFCGHIMRTLVTSCMNRGQIMHELCKSPILGV